MKVINMYSLWMPLAVMAALATLVTPPAHASVDTIYPGGQCSPTDSGSQYRALWGGLGNPDGSNYLNLTCPLAHDFNSSTGIGWGIVAVIAQNPAKDLECSLISTNISSTYSTSAFWVDFERTTTTSASTQYLHFGSLPASDHYYYECSIPPSIGAATSYVNAYRIFQY